MLKSSAVWIEWCSSQWLSAKAWDFSFCLLLTTTWQMRLTRADVEMDRQFKSNFHSSHSSSLGMAVLRVVSCYTTPLRAHFLPLSLCHFPHNSFWHHIYDIFLSALHSKPARHIGMLMAFFSVLLDDQGNPTCQAKGWSLHFESSPLWPCHFTSTWSNNMQPTSKRWETWPTYSTKPTKQ